MASSEFAYVRGSTSNPEPKPEAGMTSEAGVAMGATNPYDKKYHYIDDDNYDPHCFFSSGLAQNRKRLGFIATCSTVQCKDGGSSGYDALLPFKEDLAEWLYKMIRAEIEPEDFFPELQSGVYLCKLGIHMQNLSVKYNREHPEDTTVVPKKPPTLKYANATRKSPPFFCRDNISNFLDWSIEFGVKPSCRFETDDLTMRKNDRQIILHLMEVGRLGVRSGIEPPALIKLEMELEEDLPEPEPEPEPEPSPQKPRKGVSFLDEQVQALAAECCCSVPFKVNRVSEGRYKVGEGRTIVFVRVLRSHVMVRVGGGWETLAAYFSKTDPCRAPLDSFGKGGTQATRVKQRTESAEDLDKPTTPKRMIMSEEHNHPVQQQQQQQQYEVEEDSGPPLKPRRPSPSAMAAVKQPDPIKVQETPIKPTEQGVKKPSPPRTRSPKKAPLGQTYTCPAHSSAPTPGVTSPTPRNGTTSPNKMRPSPRTTPTPRREITSPCSERVTSPTPRPVSRTPSIVPRQTKASLLRTSSPATPKTTSPSMIKTAAPAGTAPSKSVNPPWRFSPNNSSPANPPSLARSASAPQKPASRVSGEAGPNTPNFQHPNVSSTLDRRVPPTQNKRLVPVGGKNLPKSDKYNRGTQSVPGKPKITSPELIRRAMEIMKDNGEVEKEEVVRKPSDPALVAAIEEIAEEEYLLEAEEKVEVDVPENVPEPQQNLSDTFEMPHDSGFGTLADSKPVEHFVAAADTLQDISDMMTDDQDRSELENLDDLPHDGYDDHTQNNSGQLSELCSDNTDNTFTVYADTYPGRNTLVHDSDYEGGGTTEDELNEAVAGPNYHPIRSSGDSLSSGPAPDSDRHTAVECGHEAADQYDGKPTEVFVAVTIAPTFCPIHHGNITFVEETGEDEIEYPEQAPEQYEEDDGFVEPQQCGQCTEEVAGYEDDQYGDAIHDQGTAESHEIVSESASDAKKIEIEYYTQPSGGEMFPDVDTKDPVVPESVEEVDGGDGMVDGEDTVLAADVITRGEGVGEVEQRGGNLESDRDEETVPFTLEEDGDSMAGNEVPDTEGWRDGDEEGEIYVANLGSDYDVTDQIESMNDVELAISEGEDEGAPVITENMVQRMEDYMKAKTELEDTIDEFQKILGSNDEDGSDDGSVGENDSETVTGDIPDSVSMRMEEFESAKKVLETCLSDLKSSGDKKPAGISPQKEDEVGPYPAAPSADAPASECPLEELLPAPILVDDMIQTLPPVPAIQVETVEPVRSSVPPTISEPEVFLPVGSAPIAKVQEFADTPESPAATSPTARSTAPAVIPTQTPPATTTPASVVEIPPVEVEVEAASQAESEDSVKTGEFAPSCSSFSEKVERLEALIGRQRSIELAKKAEEEKLAAAAAVKALENEDPGDKKVAEPLKGGRAQIPEHMQAAVVDLPCTAVDEDMIPEVEVDNIVNVKAVASVFDKPTPDVSKGAAIEDIPPPLPVNDFLSQEPAEPVPGKLEKQKMFFEPVIAADETRKQPKKWICDESAVKEAGKAALQSKPKIMNDVVKPATIETFTPKSAWSDTVLDPAMKPAKVSDPKANETAKQPPVSAKIDDKSVKKEAGKPIIDKSAKLDEARIKGVAKQPTKPADLNDAVKDKAMKEHPVSDEIDEPTMKPCKPHKIGDTRLEEPSSTEVLSPGDKEVDDDAVDLEVIEEEYPGLEEDPRSDGEAIHPFSDGEEVVMKPERAPLPNNNALNMAPRRYSFEPELELEKPRDYVDELKTQLPKRTHNSSGHTSDSDRSTASEKGVSDTSSGYHEDYETSDGDELGSTYTKVPDVIMEQDPNTRSILKGSVKEAEKPTLTSSATYTRQRTVSDEEVFEEQRSKGLNLPSEGIVREAVFTKAIENAINPLAYGVNIPGMDELQTASIVLPSKKAIRKASDPDYDYSDRRTNLEKVIDKPHTERTDMEWDEQDVKRTQDKTDTLTRDEKVHKWSGTLRSSQKKKKPFRTKKITEDDILSAITQTANASRTVCPVHAAAAAAAGGPSPKKRAPATKRPTTSPVTRTGTRPGARPGTMPTSARTATQPARTPPKSALKQSTPARAATADGNRTAPAKLASRKGSVPLIKKSSPVPQGSKGVPVKPASHVSTPQEIMTPAMSATSGPITSPANKTNIKVTKSTPIRRGGSLREGQRAPLKQTNSLPRDKIRSGPSCRDLP